jgi:Acetyltransferase (GNAT) domain
MTVSVIDPINDERWDEFLQKHPAASVFHTKDWLEALRRTYGYEPIAFTTSLPGRPLTNGICFCGISGWLSGRRLVSLPFSDHCEPLAEDSEQIPDLLISLRESLHCQKWKRMEIRAINPGLPECEAFEKSTVFFLHKLDLSPGIDEIFRSLHRDCVQRKVRRAMREELTHEEGRSERLLTQFYSLLLMTRRRHGLPPQPLAWFRNLVACLRDKVGIRIASKDGRPIAGILTLSHKKTLVYKYGCSDAKFRQLGGVQMLLWKAIEDAKRHQLSEFDMGRSECSNSGLVTFKDRWGTTRTQLAYLQYPRGSFHSLYQVAQNNISKRVLASMPSGLLSATGRVLYRYMG